MIISRTPFRISFLGGSTDYPGWYKKHQGATLCVTIDKYCYISCRYLPPFFGYNYRIVYTNREEVNKLSEIKHASVRETLKFLNEKRGVHIHHDGDLPARTGLGSSSAFTVGLLNALYALQGKMASKKQLALEAIEIEQNRIKENVGSQDQTITAFGGLNKITFAQNQKIEVQPITVSRERLIAFQNHLMLFFTGFSRTASKIVGGYLDELLQKKRELRIMVQLVDEGVNILNSSSILDPFGKLLDEAWTLKKSFSNKISTSIIDEVYQAGRNAGALGGKIIGAGGGGFILFFVKPEFQNKVKEKLKKLLYVPFKFETLGSQIIYYAPQGEKCLKSK